MNESQAREKARSIGHNRWDRNIRQDDFDTMISDALLSSFKQGFSAGVEASAEVADGFVDPDDNSTIGNDINAHVDMISESIRKLKGVEGK